MTKETDNVDPDNLLAGGDAFKAMLGAVDVKQQLSGLKKEVLGTRSASKVIDIHSGRWDLYPLAKADKAQALAWFAQHEGAHYDWPGIVAWVVPLVRNHPDRYVCFEAIGEMLGIANPHRLSARKLIKWAKSMANANGTTLNTMN